MMRDAVPRVWRRLSPGIPIVADLLTVVLFLVPAGIYCFNNRAEVFSVLILHPLRCTFILLLVAVFVMWAKSSSAKLMRQQRDAVIAATQAVHRHLPRLIKKAPNAERDACRDLLIAYVKYYEERFGRKAGQTWEASLWLPHTDMSGHEFLRISTSVGVSPAIEEQYLMGSEAPYYDGMAWKTWVDGQSIHSNDASKDERFDDNHRGIESQLAYEIKSIACNIVRFGDRKYGVLVVDHDRKGMFNDNDLTFNGSFARLVGAVLRVADIKDGEA